MMWISPRQLAAAAGITYRAAAKAVKKAQFAPTPWRGGILEVRVRNSRGGAGGSGYEVRLSSLPVDLQQRWAVNLRESESGASADGGSGQAKQGSAVAPWPREEREARHVAFARLPGSMQGEAKRRLLAVQHFQSSEGTGMPMLERYAAAGAYAGESASTIRRWLGMCRGVHPGDWIVALAPKHVGNHISAPISLDAFEFIKAEYFQTTKPALKPIYRRAQRVAADRGWVLPSYATVKRKIAAVPREVHVLKREGADALERLYPTQERDYSTLRLHEIWCADGRKADVFARWPDGSIGRPIVLGWIDLRSRVCVGWAIDKVEGAEVVRRSLGLAMERAKAVPEAALLDNGRAFAGHQITGGVPNRFRGKVEADQVPGILPLLGVKVTWAQPGRGRSKPIESWWRQLAETDRQFPGAYCGNRPDARPEDFGKEKAIPIAEYERAIDATLRIYHDTPHRGDAMHGRSPHQVYKELLPRTTVTQPTREQLRLCLQAAENVRLDQREHSIRVLGNRYWSRELTSLPPGIQLTVRYDPQDASVPICVYRGEEFICEAAMMERTGFQNRQAAADHMRANRAFRKGVAAQAAAMTDMRAATRWLAPEVESPASKPGGAAGELPTPKVVRPLRPAVDYGRPLPGAQSDQPEADISVDEFRAAVLRGAAKKRRAS